MLGDGNIELIASADYSGRALFNNLLIVRRIGPNFAVQELDALNLEQLNGTLVDLNSDGKTELLVPTALTPYLGGPVPQAEWTAVYSWNGAIFEENTGQFSAYYASKVLPPLQAALLSAQTTGDQRRIALAQIELDKAVRASGGATTTGLGTAEGLSSSPDPVLRSWAVAVLGDIDTPVALAIVANLEKDQDLEVARYAKLVTETALWSHCDRVGISIETDRKLPIINLQSREPIKVNIQLDPAESKELNLHSLTFGSDGFASSLISCDRDGLKTQCHFSVALSGFQPGDGIATLYGRLEPAGCIKGQTSVQVVDAPLGQWGQSNISNAVGQ